MTFFCLVCFQVFDSDKDRLLNEVELVQAIGHLCVIREENLLVMDESLHSDTHASSMAQEVLQQYGSTEVCTSMCLFFNLFMSVFLF